MANTSLFTKAQQEEQRRLQKEEKSGKDINWDEFLTKEMEKGHENWLKYSQTLKR